MPTQSNCIKCGTPTYRIQKIGNYRNIALCRDHKEEIKQDKEILLKNKEKITNLYLEKLETPAAKSIAEMMIKVAKVVENREVYKNYASGKPITAMSDEETEKEYVKFRESRPLKQKAVNE